MQRHLPVPLGIAATPTSHQWSGSICTALASPVCRKSLKGWCWHYAKYKKRQSETCSFKWYPPLLRRPQKAFPGCHFQAFLTSPLGKRALKSFEDIDYLLRPGHHSFFVSWLPVLGVSSQIRKESPAKDLFIICPWKLSPGIFKWKSCQVGEKRHEVGDHSHCGWQPWIQRHGHTLLHSQGDLHTAQLISKSTETKEKEQSSGEGKRSILKTCQKLSMCCGSETIRRRMGGRREEPERVLIYQWKP